MNIVTTARPMDPFGAALRAWLDGDHDATIIVRRDDGREVPLPAGHFFRDQDAFSDLEKRALSLCRGRVLDVGAGAGSQSLVLQKMGLAVTAIDISSDAVEVMIRRGIRDVQCADIMAFDAGPFDTLLMLGHGIGMVATIDGLRRFLARARGLIAPGGQLLLDSLDVSVSDDPDHVRYREAKRRAGVYIGEIGMSFEFRGVKGPSCVWLQVDSRTLGEEAARCGWTARVVLQTPAGDYLASLQLV